MARRPACFPARTRVSGGRTGVWTWPMAPCPSPAWASSMTSTIPRSMSQNVHISSLPLLIFPVPVLLSLDCWILSRVSLAPAEVVTG